VSIGVPVYNGEAYLEKALDSLRAQTFRDIEIVISDNGSTDATPEICRRAASDDPRIRYLRSEINRGLAWNRRRVLAAARGTYFMYADYDDFFDREYVERCVAVLDGDPRISYVFAETVLVDPDGDIIGRELTRQRTDHPSPSVRFADILSVRGGPNFYGLARRTVRNRLPRYPSVALGERIVMAALSLHTPFHMLDGDLYFRRIHGAQMTTARRNRRGEVRILDPLRAQGWRGSNLAGLAEYVYGFIVAPFRAPIPPIEKVRCEWHVLRWGIAHVPGLGYGDPRTRSIAIVRTGPGDLPAGREGIGY
jgi:glycosyltransferase involved in cell wall biosynthesis